MRQTFFSKHWTVPDHPMENLSTHRKLKHGYVGHQNNYADEPSLWTSWCWMYQMTHLRSWPLHLWSIMLAMHLKQCHLTSFLSIKCHIPMEYRHTSLFSRKYSIFVCPLLSKSHGLSHIWYHISASSWTTLAIYRTNVGIWGGNEEGKWFLDIGYHYTFHERTDNWKIIPIPIYMMSYWSWPLNNPSYIQN